MDAGPIFGAPARLVPEMSSRRLQVLAFVRDYIARMGGSPSYGEIAAGIGTNRTRVKEAVRSLAREGLLLRRPGARGLALPENQAAAIATLRALGWVVDEAIGCAVDLRARRVTDPTLLGLPVLGYCRTTAGDEDGHGSEGQEGAQGTRGHRAERARSGSPAVE